ncbi:MAG: DUF1579 family protein [Phycisphaerae bacterium]
MKFVAFSAMLCYSLVMQSFAAENPAEPRNSPEDARTAMKHLEPLVGNTYVAQFPGDQKMTDTVSFESILDGRFIRSVHVVRSADGQAVYRGETIYGYDMREGKLFYSYFNTTGGFIYGTGEYKDGAVLWIGENHADQTQPRRTRNETASISSDGFTATAYFERDGEWQKRWTLEFKRQPVTTTDSSTADSGEISPARSEKAGT